ncbi:helix-turn-helix transcriptional regulator [Actinomadura nitritigenes]|uniref:helix-turn-helix transcriptional regulator n=1 Tax=Actinomadura nitritigenes TaxID=134602 RepID=UPI003D93F0B6
MEDLSDSERQVGAGDDRHLSPEDLAERWQISVEAVYKRNQRGNGPPFMRLGPRLIRYKLADVEAYENARYVDREAS